MTKKAETLRADPELKIQKHRRKEIRRCFWTWPLGHRWGKWGVCRYCGYMPSDGYDI